MEREDLIECPACGKKVSRRTRYCPNCGHCIGCYV